MLSDALLSIEHSDNRLEATSPLPPHVCKKKALLIGIQNYNSTNVQSYGEDKPVDNYTDSGEGQLKGPHVDVQDLRQLLLDCYDYKPDDITVLIDDRDPEHVQPTEENLIQSMKDLVADACSGDQFYLHFSGHGSQLPDDNGDEEDGWDECIVTCDEKTIRDDLLNELLVAPLPIGSTFVSTFDSCHSGTLLDLAHYRCNRVYVPWVNKGIRRTAFLRNIVARQETQLSETSDNSDSVEAPVIQFIEEPAAIELSIVPPDEGVLVAPNVPQHTQHSTLSINTDLSTGKWIDSRATPLEFSLSPLPSFCTGTCREKSEEYVKPMADVISISATKDYQLSWEDSHGYSMTEALIKVLRMDPQSSLKDILAFISHELHDFYVNLHDESRVYKNNINAANIKRQRKGKRPWQCRTVEMNNFQNPQISSHRPLDMNRPLPL